MINNLKFITGTETINCEGDRIFYSSRITEQKLLREIFLSPKIKSKTKILGKIGFMNWILLVECNSRENTIKSTDYIYSHLKLNYTTFQIQSDPEKYLIVVSKTGTLHLLLRILKFIPGADPKYVDFCTRYKIISLKAFPDEFIPHIENIEDAGLEEECERFVKLLILWFIATKTISLEK